MLKLKGFYIENKNWVLMLLWFLILFSFILGGCSYLNYKFSMPPDTLQEKKIEEEIKLHRGVYIDLPPQSPESEEKPL